MKSDLKVLIECMKDVMDSPGSQTQALHTIITICSQSQKAQNYLHECGGLQFIFNLAISDLGDSVRTAALFCVASCVQDNVSIQSQYNDIQTFNHIRDILTHTNTSPVLKQAVTYFLTSQVSNNSKGQVLVMKSGCLQVLIHLFRSLFVGMEAHIPDGEVGGLWLCVLSALGVCVNNPLNEDNQRVCGSVLPFACQLLHILQNLMYIAPVARFIAFAAANNVQNQMRVAENGGLLYLTHHIQSLTLDSSNIPLAVQLATALDACVMDNAHCISEAGDKGAINALLCIVPKPGLTVPGQVQITLTLAHLMDGNEENQVRFQELGGVNTLVQLMSVTDDDDLHKTIKYSLQVALTNGIHTSTSQERQHSDPIETIWKQIEELFLKIEGVERENLPFEQKMLQNRVLADINKQDIGMNISDINHDKGKISDNFTGNVKEIINTIIGKSANRFHNYVSQNMENSVVNIINDAESTGAMRENSISAVSLNEVTSGKEHLDKINKVTGGKEPINKVTSGKERLNNVTNGKEPLSKVTGGKEPLNKVTTGKVSSGKEPINKVTGGKEPLNKVTVGKEPLDKNSGKEPLNKVTDGKEPLNKVTDGKEPLNKVIGGKEPTTLGEAQTNIPSNGDKIFTDTLQKVGQIVDENSIPTVHGSGDVRNSKRKSNDIVDIVDDISDHGDVCNERNVDDPHNQGNNVDDPNNEDNRNVDNSDNEDNVDNNGDNCMDNNEDNEKAAKTREAQLEQKIAELERELSIRDAKEKKHDDLAKEIANQCDSPTLSLTSSDVPDADDLCNGRNSDKSVNDKTNHILCTHSTTKKQNVKVTNVKTYRDFENASNDLCLIEGNTVEVHNNTDNEKENRPSINHKQSTFLEQYNKNNSIEQHEKQNNTRSNNTRTKVFNMTENNNSLTTFGNKHTNTCFKQHIGISKAMKQNVHTSIISTNASQNNNQQIESGIENIYEPVKKSQRRHDNFRNYNNDIPWYDRSVPISPPLLGNRDILKEHNFSSIDLQSTFDSGDKLLAMNRLQSSGVGNVVSSNRVSGERCNSKTFCNKGGDILDVQIVCGNVNGRIVSVRTPHKMTSHNKSVTSQNKSMTSQLCSAAKSQQKPMTSQHCSMAKSQQKLMTSQNKSKSYRDSEMSNAITHQKPIQDKLKPVHDLNICQVSNAIRQQKPMTSQDKTKSYQCSKMSKLMTSQDKSKLHDGPKICPSSNATTQQNPMTSHRTSMASQHEALTSEHGSSDSQHKPMTSEDLSVYPQHKAMTSQGPLCTSTPCDLASHLSSIPRCPGCSSSKQLGTQLNSRTLQVAIDSSPHTCSVHKRLRDMEIRYLQQQKQASLPKLNESIYEDDAKRVEENKRRKIMNSKSRSNNKSPIISPLIDVVGISPINPQSTTHCFTENRASVQKRHEKSFANTLESHKNGAMSIGYTLKHSSGAISGKRKEIKDNINVNSTNVLNVPDSISLNSKNVLNVPDSISVNSKNVSNMSDITCEVTPYNRNNVDNLLDSANTRVTRQQTISIRNENISTSNNNNCDDLNDFKTPYDRKKAEQQRCIDITSLRKRRRSQGDPDYREIGEDGESVCGRSSPALSTSSRLSTRRTRVDYTKQELSNLIHGVKRLGSRWTQIMWLFEFHPCRTAVDLKEKYSRIKASHIQDTLPPLYRDTSFYDTNKLTPTEEWNLKYGVGLLPHVVRWQEWHPIDDLTHK